MYPGIYMVSFRVFKCSLHYSPAFNVLFNGCVIQWADKIKYLSCFFNENCHVDYTAGIQKFYGDFTNILSILGRNRNDMSAVHLTVSYCVPSQLSIDASFGLLLLPLIIK